METISDSIETSRDQRTKTKVFFVKLWGKLTNKRSHVEKKLFPFVFNTYFLDLKKIIDIKYRLVVYTCGPECGVCALWMFGSIPLKILCYFSILIVIAIEPIKKQMINLEYQNFHTCLNFIFNSQVYSRNIIDYPVCLAPTFHCIFSIFVNLIKK